MVSAPDGSACPECGVDLKKITCKKMEADNEKLRKENEKLKAMVEKAEKGAALSLKEKEQMSKTMDDNKAQSELRRVTDNDLITKLNRQVDNFQREKQAAGAETAVKAVDSSATTQANTTTAGPVAPSHSLPSDGVQVLPPQGVPQGLNSSTPLPSRGAMRGARAQNLQGPREYYNQNLSSHWSITFQDPLVQQVHTVEGGHGYVDPYYDEPTDFQEVRIGDCNSTAPQFNQSTRGTFHPPQRQYQPQPHFLPSQPPPQPFPPP
ncbi:MAG: hypothetical protein GY820_33185 [Gammaproteobacteria bacterium]|nr:hypothetical protein [Gammaproteobacteria bacterium]